MVDNAWRDSIVVKHKLRLRRDEKEEAEALKEQDNSSLLDLERKANFAKPSGGDGIFAGTSFETATLTGQAALIKSGLTLSNSAASMPSTRSESIEEIQREGESEGGASTKRRGISMSIYNKATAALDNFAERLSSSGGGIRGSNKDEDGEEYHGPRKSTAPQRVKSIVRATLTKATSRRKTKLENVLDGFDNELEADTIASADNPKFAFAKEDKIAEESATKS
jgi:hypothetical protein